MANKKEVSKTREQLIADAYKSISSFNENYLDVKVPEHRKLYIGDEVEIGNLIDCIVIETSPDFKEIIIEYTSVDNNYGNPITTTGKIGGWNWLDSIKKNSNKENMAVNRPVSVSLISTDLSGLINSVVRRGLIDSPDYQRGYVWTEQDKVNYIQSAFEDRDLGKFVFVEDTSYKEYRLEVLDGKQRMSALLDFTCSLISYKGVYWHELSKRDRRSFGDRMVQYATIDRNRYSRADLLKLFLEVNAAGVPQTEEHLDFVRELLIQEEAKGEK